MSKVLIKIKSEKRVENDKRLKRNQIAYIAEAALEYFISLLVTGAFLATILKNIGVPDEVTGVISTLTSLGISAQFFAVLFLRPKGKGKRMVTILHFMNQLMFSILYLIPYIHVPQAVKVAVFVIMFLSGHIISNMAVPYKLSWLMSYVPDDERGRFTANKEIVSLLLGMLVSYIMGTVIDHYNEIGNSEMGFVISGLTLFGLCILHLVSLLCIKDDDKEIAGSKEIIQKTHTVKSVLNISLFDKNFRKIILLDVLWNFGTGISTGFYGVYQINELGFSLKYVAILSVVNSLVRVAFSGFFGRIADKYSWAKMMILSFEFGAVSFLINTFTIPANGKLFFALYYVFYAIFMAGANSGMMNIVFDYVKYEDRPYALGVKSAIGGIFGFLASLVGAALVSVVQTKGNTVFGITIYAQQILSFITFIVFAFIVFYIKNVILKMKKAVDSNDIIVFEDRK
ncbi:MAG: MFS transporter [Clostridiales bacterium]|nr:MFS transporter [Clostridiales bacterium]